LDEAQRFAVEIYESLVVTGIYVPKMTMSVIPEAFNQQLLHDLIQEVLLGELEKVSRDEIKHASYLMSKIRLEGLIFDFLNPAL
jgi:hypothetical protein